MGGAVNENVPGPDNYAERRKGTSRDQDGLPRERCFWVGDEGRENPQSYTPSQTPRPGSG